MALIEFENNSAPYLNAENLNNNFEYLENLNNYSTDEIVVGKWTDNKPIYRKVISTNLPTPLDANAWLNLFEISNVSKMINIYGIITKNDGDYSIPRYENLDYFLNFKYYNGYCMVLGKGFDGSNINLVLEYTKTTD